MVKVSTVFFADVAAKWCRSKHFVVARQRNTIREEAGLPRDSDVTILQGAIARGREIETPSCCLPYFRVLVVPGLTALPSGGEDCSAFTRSARAPCLGATHTQPKLALVARYKKRRKSEKHQTITSHEYLLPRRDNQNDNPSMLT